MKNTELIDKAKVSKSTFYKIKNDEIVISDVLLKLFDVIYQKLQSVLKNKYKMEQEKQDE